MLGALKSLVPNRDMPLRVWRGPFRGARVVMNPRVSMRKVLGLYEHELNGWLEAALGRVTRVLDVGANDGYFTFGCAAALERRGVGAEIIAFEPQDQHVGPLREAAALQPRSHVRLAIVQAMVGARAGEGMTTLDAQPAADRSNTLIKIDVEGAEADVIAGAASWLKPGNLFLIEVHRADLLDRLRRTFQSAGLELELVEQQPLPILGREERDRDNWWLVSRLETR